MALARESKQRVEHTGPRPYRSAPGSRAEAKDYSRKMRRHLDRRATATWTEGQ